MHRMDQGGFPHSDGLLYFYLSQINEAGKESDGWLAGRVYSAGVFDTGGIEIFE